LRTRFEAPQVRVLDWIAEAGVEVISIDAGHILEDYISQNRS